MSQTRYEAYILFAKEEKEKEKMDLITYSELYKVYKPFTIFGSLKELQTLNPHLNQ